MPETRRRYDAEFREGAVGIVRETGRPDPSGGSGPRCPLTPRCGGPPGTDRGLRATACGSAARTLTRLAEGAELIVVGNRRLGTFASPVAGSVSQQCAHDASCPVMIVPVPRP
jgi:hypothetical protein